MENMQAYAQLLSAGSSAYGAYSEGENAGAAGRWQRESADFEARMLDLQASDATRRGEIAARHVQSKARQIIGSQRAALAAQGVSVDRGSAVDVQADSAYQASLDADTLKANAWREAWGLKTAASEKQYQGRMAELTGESRRTAGYLTAAANLTSGAMKGYEDYRWGQKSEDRPKTAKASRWEADAWNAKFGG